MSVNKSFVMKREGDLGIVTIDVPGQPMNTWTEKAIEDFLALLQELEQSSDLKGVVFVSAKKGNFHAGADLKMLNTMTDEEQTAKALDLFHAAFKRLSSLAFPTVAAIDGHCLGGGMEFALACTARVAKDSRDTKLGLPECSLGIFPGGGGTQRLPRLIGIPAIELILRGTVMPVAKALELGIVDKLVPADGDLLQESVSFANGISAQPGILNRPGHDFSQIDLISEMARKEVLKATKGREIPGPMLAVDSIRDGLKTSLEEGLDIEKRNFVKAVLSPEAKGSIHTFFLKTMSDKPRSLVSKGFNPKPMDTVAILGFGTMGRGIAIDILRNTNKNVVVKDLAEALEPGKTFVKKILDGMAEKNKLKGSVDDMMARLTMVTEYQDLKDADLVIEAVFEDIAVKKEVYEELCTTVRDDCIIASNTSSIPLDKMSPFVTNPARFAGLHFFSPVWMMQLVEIVRGQATSQDAVDNLLGFVADIRKRPVVCRDNPGFVVNAVLFPYFQSAIEFLENGNTIEEVDKAFVKFGMPIGPIRLTDEVGIDVCYKVMVGRGQAQQTLKNLVSAGRLGVKKSGKGFFLLDGSVDPDVVPLIAKQGDQKVSAEDMQLRVLRDMVTVAKDLLDRGVVEDPRMVDMGMIWATGFPAEKGGPLKWADLTGLSEKLFGKQFYG